MTPDIVSRFTDVSMPGAVPIAAAVATTGLPAVPLPAVDWKQVGMDGPTPAKFSYAGPNAALPAADAVIMTWTSAEWAALDHVFVDSQSAFDPKSAGWVANWHLYSLGAPPPGPARTATPAPATLAPLASAAVAIPPLWGYYQLIDVPNRDGEARRVLLFKSDTHLAHPPWSGGLKALTDRLLAETGAKTLYSIGTAGGSRDNVHLGDVVVTNAAHAQLQKPDNVNAPINGQTCTSIGLFPDSDVWKAAQEHLFFRLSTLVTNAALEALAQKLLSTSKLQLDDLVNAAIDPTNLGAPSALACPGQPLLTTDYYYIASSSADDKWSALEMDDAFIGAIAGADGATYLFVRNISDPLVPFDDRQGQPIPADVRTTWSSLIYTKYGAYTSFNGALTTWAIISGT